MSASYFLWPKPSIPHLSDFFGKEVYSRDVEELLKTLYPMTFPVLFTSARAGLSAVIFSMGLSRPDHVWLPEYSSHCVLEAVSLFATPTPAMCPNVKAALVFHQWGHIHKVNFPSNIEIIEDSADSLLIPGSSVFAIDGSRYVIWSLPKVIGTMSGGVVFCKFPEEAEKLRVIRDSRPSGALQMLLRIIGQRNNYAALYWNGVEASHGVVPLPFRRQIMRKLKEISTLVDRIADMLYALSPLEAERMISKGRLPSNIPLSVPSWWQEYWGEGRVFTAGLRHFNSTRCYPNEKWVKVAPLPIHCDINVNVLKEVKNKLEKEEDNAFKYV